MPSGKLKVKILQLKIVSNKVDVINKQKLISLIEHTQISVTQTRQNTKNNMHNYDFLIGST